MEGHRGPPTASQRPMAADTGLQAQNPQQPDAERAFEPSEVAKVGKVGAHGTMADGGSGVEPNMARCAIVTPFGAPEMSQSDVAENAVFGNLQQSRIPKVPENTQKDSQRAPQNMPDQRPRLVV